MKAIALRNVPGTDYTRRTNSRPIYVPSLGIYISNPLTSGNSKLAKNVLIFDLLAVHDCRNCSTCAGSCYAVKAQRQYAETWNRRSILSYLARHDLAFLEQIIRAQLAKTRKPFVRIHSAGDFISQAYVDMWARIIADFPAIRFYTYSKVTELFDFSSLYALANFNMVDSLPDGLRNYGSLEYCRDLVANHGCTLCPYGVDQHRDPVHCGTDCTACMSDRRVCFLEH